MLEKHIEHMGIGGILDEIHSSWLSELWREKDMDKIKENSKEELIKFHRNYILYNIEKGELKNGDRKKMVI